MSRMNWSKDLLWFIGQVVTLESKDKVRKGVLIINISLDEKYIFYDDNKRPGRRGFWKMAEDETVYCDVTGEKPAYKVPTPRSLNPETLNRNKKF